MLDVKRNWRAVWKNEYTDKAKEEMKRKIQSGKFDYHITKCKYAKERIVEELIVQEIPFKVQSLGCGFYKIYALDCVCSECKGRGVVKKKEK